MSNQIFYVHMAQNKNEPVTNPQFWYNSMGIMQLTAILRPGQSQELSPI